MHPSISNLCTALDNLAAKITAGHSTKATLADNWGWHHPALTTKELAYIPLSISQRLKDLNLTEIDAQLKAIIDVVPNRIATLEAQNLPYFYNGHGHQSIPSFLAFCYWLNTVLQPLIGWTIMNDSKAMPLQLSKKLKVVQSQFDELAEGKDELIAKVKLINEAHLTAENLPVDLAALKDTRKKMDGLHTDSVSLFGKIEALFNDSKNNSKIIGDKKIEAEKLVAQCEVAYQITTTKGLAGAFNQRANALNWSMYGWVLGLLSALAIGAWIGSQRVDILSKALQDKDPSMLVVWTNVILSVFSIGAPVWFAWIATKQISQRFKLAEDYAFKSSVAKAYEGYKREAARIDPTFESRLFASALTRLEEPPLRVMEHQHYSSPWQELLDMPEFKEALKQSGLKEKILSKLKMNKIDETPS